MEKEKSVVISHYGLCGTFCIRGLGGARAAEEVPPREDPWWTRWEVGCWVFCP